MFSIDFLMLSACDAEITDISSSCFNACVLFSLSNETCLFSPSIWLVQSLVLSRQVSFLSIAIIQIAL